MHLNVLTAVIMSVYPEDLEIEVPNMYTYHTTLLGIVKNSVDVRFFKV